MQPAETPHILQYAQHCNWQVGLTDVPKDWLLVANAKCLHFASPAGLVPQPRHVGTLCDTRNGNLHCNDIVIPVVTGFHAHKKPFRHIV